MATPKLLDGCGRPWLDVPRRKGSPQRTDIHEFVGLNQYLAESDLKTDNYPRQPDRGNRQLCRL